MVFNSEGFLELSIESWPECKWYLGPRQLNSVQTL